MSPKVKEFFNNVLSYPVLIVSCVAALGTAATFVLGDFDTPNEKFVAHIQKDNEIHAEEREEHKMFVKALQELDTHSEDNEESMNAILRGECLENKPENLARQGLLNKCRALGINR